MSVSQVKKRFVEMESYLRNDKEGLRRLKLLKDDVNVLRTSLASAEEKAEELEVVKNAARDRADNAEAELDLSRIEVHSLKQQVASLMTDLATATRPDEENVDEVNQDVSLNRFSQGMKSTLKSLLHGNEMPRRPDAYARYRRDGGNLCHAFFRNDIATGWTRRSIYLIGALVAIMVDVEGEVKIRSHANTEEGKDGIVKDETLIRHLLRWYRIDSTETQMSGTGIFTHNLR